MALDFQVDSLDSVPNVLRGHYVERDGKFQLDVSNLPEPTGLKTALEKERADNKALKKLGKTPEELRTLLDREAEIAERSANLDALARQAAAKSEQEKTALQAELNAARTSERDAIVGATLATALANAKATVEGHDLLSERLSARVSLETRDGRRVATILARDGKPMLVAGKPASFADLIADAKAQFPSLFQGTGAGGGGTPPKQGAEGSKTIKRSEFDALPPLQQAATIKSGVQLVD